MGEELNPGYVVDIDSIHVDQEFDSVVVLYTVKETSSYETNDNLSLKSNKIVINSKFLNYFESDLKIDFYRFYTVFEKRVDDIQFKYHNLANEVFVNAKMDEKTTTGYNIKLTGFKKLNNKLITYYSVNKPYEGGVYAQYNNSPEVSKRFFMNGEISEDSEFSFKKEQPYIEYKLTEIMDKVLQSSKYVHSYQADFELIINNLFVKMEMNYSSSYNSDKYIHYIKVYNNENAIEYYESESGYYDLYMDKNYSSEEKNDKSGMFIKYYDFANDLDIQFSKEYFNKEFKEDDDYYYLKLESKLDNAIYDYKINKKTFLIEEINAILEDSNAFNSYKFKFSSFNKVQEINLPKK